MEVVGGRVDEQRVAIHAVGARDIVELVAVDLSSSTRAVAQQIVVDLDER